MFGIKLCGAKGAHPEFRVSPNRHIMLIRYSVRMSRSNAKNRSTYESATGAGAGEGVGRVGDYYAQSQCDHREISEHGSGPILSELRC